MGKGIANVKSEEVRLARYRVEIEVSGAPAWTDDELADAVLALVERGPEPARVNVPTPADAPMIRVQVDDHLAELAMEQKAKPARRVGQLGLLKGSKIRQTAAPSRHDRYTPEADLMAANMFLEKRPYREIQEMAFPKKSGAMVAPGSYSTVAGMIARGLDHIKMPGAVVDPAPASVPASEPAQQGGTCGAQEPVPCAATPVEESAGSTTRTPCQSWAERVLDECRKECDPGNPGDAEGLACACAAQVNVIAGISKLLSFPESDVLQAGHRRLRNPMTRDLCKRIIEKADSNG